MKTGVMMLKIQLCITGTNYILEIDYLNFNNISHFYLFLLYVLFKYMQPW